MDRHSQTLAVGSQLQHYQIQSVLGEGGFGATYKAYNTRIKQTVAIKEYLPSELAFRESSTTQVHARSGGKQEEFTYGLKKFLEEAQTLAQFNHPNIVRAYDFFEENGTGYLVMEYADGQSLDELLDAGGPLTESKLLEYLNPLLDGLAKVHRQGILHRDIKPANIYIRKDGGPLLIDFGAARHEVGKNSNSISAIVSPGYAAPEQYSTNSKFQGPWTDLYALGATLYKCVTGNKPAESPERREALEHDQPDPLQPSSHVVKGYSASLLQAIDSLLALKAKQRPQSVADLQALISGNGQKASQPKLDSATRRVTNDEAGFSENGSQQKDQTGVLKKAGIAVGLIALLGTGLWLIPNSDKPIEDREPVTQQTPQAQAILNRAQQQAAQRTPNPPPAEQSSIAPTLIEPTPPPEPVTHQLWVNTTPSDARVILPDEPAHVRYYDGIELAPENHRIKITANGYYPQSLQANLTYGDQTLNVALKAKPQRLPYEPEMVSIPGGSFMMGSKDGDSDEKPVHRVSIKPFNMGKYEVTKGQFSEFVKATGYRTDAEKNVGGEDGCYAYKGGTEFGWSAGTSWRNPGYQQGDQEPVVCISYNDASAFAEWISAKTGKSYRLPTEAEWEYAARAGSSSKYHFGNRESQLCEYGNGADQSAGRRFSGWTINSCNDGYTFTAPIGSFKSNRFGLYDLHGNAWEWMQDCWNESYQGAPSNGSAWRSGDCAKRVLRGGSWNFTPNNLRSASRLWITASDRLNDGGFRLAQDP